MNRTSAALVSSQAVSPESGMAVCPSLPGAVKAAVQMVSRLVDTRILKPGTLCRLQHAGRALRWCFPEISLRLLDATRQRCVPWDSAVRDARRSGRVLADRPGRCRRSGHRSDRLVTPTLGVQRDGADGVMAGAGEGSKWQR